MTPDKWSSDEFATMRETIAEVCARLTKVGWIEKSCVTNTTFLIQCTKAGVRGLGALRRATTANDAFSSLMKIPAPAWPQNKIELMALLVICDDAVRSEGQADSS